MRPPLHHRRAEARLRRRGAGWERLRIPRPEAGGEAAALRLTPSGAPRGRVVAVHGAGNDALFPLVALYEALLGRGFEIFAFDVDGSGWESTTRFAPETARTAVASAIRTAQGERAPLPLLLLGHSLGGSLVLDALSAGEAGEVRAAAVLSAPLEIRLSTRVAIAELAGFLRVETLAQRAYYGLWGVVPAVGLLKRSAYPFRGARGLAHLGYVSAVNELLRSLELDRAGAGIRAPVLLVYGEEDHLVPPWQGEEIAARVEAGTLLRVEDASHYSLPFHPLAVARVAEWMEARAGV